MATGWVKSHRKIVEWQWYTDVSTCHLFRHLVLMANNSDGYWQGKKVNRGQRITSLSHLSHETGLSVQQVRTGMRKLKRSGEITSQATNQYSLITIINYDKYQSEQERATSKPTNQATGKQQASNKQATTNKNDKKEKNDKKLLYGESKHVLLTKEEYNELVKEYGQTLVDLKLDALDNQIHQGYKKALNYKDHKRTLSNWCKKYVAENKLNKPPSVGDIKYECEV